MSIDSPLEDLLDEWEDRYAAGDPISLEELCADCPELLPEMQRRVAAIQQMDGRLDTVDQSTGGDGTDSRDGKLNVNSLVLAYDSKLGHLLFHAKGGLGSVYVAKDQKLHRDVAVKFIHRRLLREPEARARFLIEAEVTARLEHPGIIPVHGFGQNDDGRLYYVMRFIQGDTLEAAIKRFHDSGNRPNGLALHQLLTAFVAVCRTIAYAHNCGIVHRDIKPENIMLGKYGETLVVDWGLALPVGRDERARSSGERTLMPSGGSQSGSASGTGAGTPAYMSPEQHAEAEVIGPASDIYSLGVTLYKLLCGQNPFQAKHHHELKQKVIRGEFVRPRKLNSAIPLALEAICLRAMAVQPEQRYASALDLAADVEHYLADDPVQAFREPISYKLARWTRRHRSGALIAASSVAVLLLGAIGSAFWFSHVANITESARSDAVAAQKASLETSAYFAAQLFGGEVDRRWRVLEAEANSQRLREMMQAVRQDPANRELWRPVQAWLTQRKDEHAAATGASNWLVNFVDGVQIARAPLTEETRKTIGENFAYRNYFHTLRKDFETPEAALAALENKTAARISGPHLSAPYIAKPQNTLKVAFTVPIWSSDPEDPSREMLGILGLSLDLGAFKVLKDAMLVDLNETWLDGQMYQGLVLQHPKLDELNTNTADRTALLKPINPQLVERLSAMQAEAVATAHNNPQGVVSSLLLTDFRDPFQSADDAARSRAACSAVLVRGRENGVEKTGWVVIVAESDLQSE